MSKVTDAVGDGHESRRRCGVSIGALWVREREPYPGEGPRRVDDRRATVEPVLGRRRRLETGLDSVRPLYRFQRRRRFAGAVLVGTGDDDRHDREFVRSGVDSLPKMCLQFGVGLGDVDDRVGRAEVLGDGRHAVEHRHRRPGEERSVRALAVVRVVRVHDDDRVAVGFSRASPGV